MIWNNTIKINVEREITAGASFGRGKKSMQSLALFNFKCGIRDLFFKRNFKESSQLKPMGDLVQRGDSLRHILLSLRIRCAEPFTPPRPTPLFPGNFKVGPCTKARGKCSMDLVTNVKATLCIFFLIKLSVQLSRVATIHLWTDCHLWMFAYIF